ncbi:hypothetical protein [Qipengyuania sp. JC766]|uniref:hypothetical protein n=1 Tax=Qipengyuania sp. JC766 TaxID=3232139 RepID=UPI0034598A0D
MTYQVSIFPKVFFGFVAAAILITFLGFALWDIADRISQDRNQKKLIADIDSAMNHCGKVSGVRLEWLKSNSLNSFDASAELLFARTTEEEAFIVCVSNEIPHLFSGARLHEACEDPEARSALYRSISGQIFNPSQLDYDFAVIDCLDSSAEERPLANAQTH